MSRLAKSSRSFSYPARQKPPLSLPQVHRMDFILRSLGVDVTACDLGCLPICGLACTYRRSGWIVVCNTRRISGIVLLFPWSLDMAIHRLAHPGPSLLAYAIAAFSNYTTPPSPLSSFDFSSHHSTHDLVISHRPRLLPPLTFATGNTEGPGWPCGVFGRSQSSSLPQSTFPNINIACSLLSLFIAVFLHVLFSRRHPGFCSCFLR